MKTRLLPLLSTSILLTSCGGGGGDSSSVIPGVWFGTVSLVDNNCADLNPAENYLSFSHLINQSEDNVFIDNGIQTFQGKTTSENSFQAEFKRNTGDQPSCQETLSWRYEKITEKQAPFVVRKRSKDCGTKGTCTSTWTGSGYNSEFNGGGFPYPLYEGSASDAPLPLQGGIEDAQAAAVSQSQ